MLSMPLAWLIEPVKTECLFKVLISQYTAYY